MRLRTQLITVAATIALVAGLGAAATSSAQSSTAAAHYTADGKMLFPRDYRTWVFLSAGMDMAYGENAPAASVHVFDNVFVDRRSYARFQETGRWPEGAVFVLEIRRAVAEGSINRRGQFQTQLAAVEAHVKDKRYKSGWAFFNFHGEAPGAPLPQDSQCNQCHEQHGATDTTFVQFYPTLMPIARGEEDAERRLPGQRACRKSR